MRTWPITLVAIVALLAGGVAPVRARAPHCLRDGCAQRFLDRAARCFDPEGHCVQDPGGVTCWENGARSEVVTYVLSGAERAVYRGPTGRLCQTITSVRGADGFQRTTHRRGRRQVVFRASADGLLVRCPGGRVERYTAADLAAPECASTAPPPPACDPGSCD